MSYYSESLKLQRDILAELRRMNQIFEDGAKRDAQSRRKP